MLAIRSMLSIAWHCPNTGPLYSHRVALLDKIPVRQFEWAGSRLLCDGNVKGNWRNGKLQIFMQVTRYSCRPIRPCLRNGRFNFVLWESWFGFYVSNCPAIEKFDDRWNSAKPTADDLKPLILLWHLAVVHLLISRSNVTCTSLVHICLSILVWHSNVWWVTAPQTILDDLNYEKAWDDVNFYSRMLLVLYLLVCGHSCMINWSEHVADLTGWPICRIEHTRFENQAMCVPWFIQVQTHHLSLLRRTLPNTRSSIQFDLKGFLVY